MEFTYENIKDFKENIKMNIKTAFEHDENETKYIKMCEMQLSVKGKFILKSTKEEKCLKSMTSAFILRNSENKSKVK